MNEEMQMIENNLNAVNFSTAETKHYHTWTNKEMSTIHGIMEIVMFVCIVSTFIGLVSGLTYMITRKTNKKKKILIGLLVILIPLLITIAVWKFWNNSTLFVIPE